MKNIFGEVTGLDEKMVEALTKAIEARNLPGFDYIEFKQSLQALSKLNMDEATAIKSSFATASTVGLTKEKLLNTAGHYKQVLHDERTQFEAAMQKQIEQKIDGKQKEVEDLKAKISQLEAEIQKLQGQISEATQTINNADSDIQAAKDKISQTRNNFDHTFQSLINQIDKDIENIGKYL